MPAANPSLELFGASWCPDCHRLQQFLGSHKVDYIWHDIDRDPGAAARAAKLNGGTVVVPTALFADQTYLLDPTDQEVASKIGLDLSVAQDYSDLAIVGAGPTGMAAAIYTTREDIKTVLFEPGAVGGLTSTTDRIDNYPGFPDGVGGLDLADNLEKQARRFGAEFRLGVKVIGITDQGRYKQIETSAGMHYAKSVLIATGSRYRRLEVPGEAELTSKGVHYCATCDGPVYKGKEVFVIGGGNSAMQESLFLSKFASKITLLVRGTALKGSEFLIKKVTSMPNLTIQYNSAVKSLKRENARVVIDVVEGDHETKLETDGVFVFIGLTPNTQWIKPPIRLDEAGFVKTDKTLQTNMPGVYAAGDVRSGSTLQIASAVGEGVTAALMIRDYLSETG